MSKPHAISRRSAFSTLAGAAGAAIALSAADTETAAAQAKAPLKGRLKQSVCAWCYRGLSLDELCQHAARIGLKSVEIIDPDQFATVKKHGLICAMSNGPGSIPKGWNRVENHDKLVKESERILPLVAKAGFPNMIVFSGNRRGLSDAEGLKNCAKGIKRITRKAEKLGVTVCMEILNSKRSHKDYQCDHTAWGADLVNEVGSDRFKLLYDIFHVQIMEGDIIATIQENIDVIGHFHTGGVPGRNEIDDTQELNYTRICQAIVDTGYTGYIAQEFVPKRDPIASLEQAVRICDV